MDLISITFQILGNIQDRYDSSDTRQELSDLLNNSLGKNGRWAGSKEKHGQLIVYCQVKDLRKGFIQVQKSLEGHWLQPYATIKQEQVDE